MAKRRAPDPAPAPDAAPADGGKAEAFYDARFSIEAMQHEPYENGFTWRSIIGALFIAFVMLPGIIVMGLMIGQDIGNAADYVVIILFVELARRSFQVLRKQELYILRYTVGQLSTFSGGVALSGGMFATLVYNRYLRNSEAFHNFGISRDVPGWFAPFGDVAYSPFWHQVWWPVIGVIIAGMILGKLTSLSLGFLAYKLTADVEKLPFPLAPIGAEGAIALAESSQEKNTRGYRQYCFSVGVVLGAVFGIFYMAVPALTRAFTGTTLTLLPIPFLDLTVPASAYIPGGMLTISFNLALIFTGFVLPWRIVVGMVGTSLLFQLVVNPLLQVNGLLPSWQYGKGAIETQIAATIDVYLSVGIGTSFAVFFVGLFGIARALSKYRRNRAVKASEFDIRKLWERDKGRGDPPTWVAFAVWFSAACGFVFLSNHLVNSGIPPEERFHIGWLIGFAFLWTPINTYINARMSGIAGQHAGVPFIFESAIFASGYRHVNIWFAPLPLGNFGGMADFLRETQLTRTRFTSILKVEMLTFPLMLVASFIFWSYVDSLGRIPSQDYPHVQQFWPQFATMRAMWAASMQEGSSLLLQALKPRVIIGALLAAIAAFSLFAKLGISSQYIYGSIGSMNSFPHTAIMILTGALLGRYFFARKFGKEKWQNYAPILAVGFGAGMGLTGMLAIAINFLWAQIGTGF